MNLKDSFAGLFSFWNEFRRDKSGLIGMGILVASLLTIAFEPLIVTYPDVNTKWRDIDYWQDNPRAAPPAWANLFSAQKKAVTTRLAKPVVTKEEGEGITLVKYSFPYAYRYDMPPLDLILKAKGKGTFPVIVSLERPDGKTVELYQYVAEDFSDEELRISLANDAQDGAYQFLATTASAEALTTYDSKSVNTTAILFAVADGNIASSPQPLKGNYQIVIQSMKPAEEEGIIDPRVQVVGAVSGALGTDGSKRDIFSGLIAGLKWALMIGFVTSAISVLIGVLYGIISAYFGGIVDVIMTFIFEIFVSMPVLPILIVMSAVFKPSIWFIILALVIFSWVGPVKTVRSMALQIKEETYIEAARALGAGKWRIIFKHMTPLLIPYSFASMALAVPGAILYEASVSLLGLGDATITTWGQILHDALSGGAVLNGLWWWVVPPGFFIAIMGMSFAFIGSAMDKILHPKLRTR